ncbi:GAF and ANTAR domain-containing protein [Actinocorallia longicatena]|uniref:GAF and ANTAR domain-containing protein n=1 Tax=Actinocorallia longicatena TaxID=111803 RepID=UPI0031DDB8E8
MSVEHACLACAQAVDAAGAGLSMRHGAGLREPVYATDARSAEVADLQFTLGEGPCMDALAGDGPVLVQDLESADSRRRWPAFAPAAVVLGVRGVFSIPVRAGAVRFGVIDLYRDLAGPLSGEQLLDVLAYADALMVLVLDHRGGISSRLDRFLDDEFVERRAGVHQAAGMVSVQLDIDVADALARLRAYAYAHDRRLDEVSASVVARRMWFDPISGEAHQAMPPREIPREGLGGGPNVHEGETTQEDGPLPRTDGTGMEEAE